MFKYDTIVVHKDFFRKVQNVFSTYVKALRTDNSCEFFNTDFTKLLSTLGII